MVWFAIAIAGMALLQSAARARILLAVSVVPVILLLIDPATPHHFNVWTPYQQIELKDELFPGGELKFSEIRVNHTGYQMMVNLSADFLARHPGLLQRPADEIPYNLPFRFTNPHPRVLIVGSGTGNDVAAALRNQSSSVDAVEIDPVILKLGQRHPEIPVRVEVPDHERARIANRAARLIPASPLPARSSASSSRRAGRAPRRPSPTAISPRCG